MHKRLFLAVATVLLLTACGVDGEDTQTPATDEEETDSPGADPANGDLTLDAVEDNDSAESCWTVIDGVVYDLTDWIAQHPGGEDRIIGLCGTDGTEQFEQQHGGDSRPANQLEEFELGPVE